MQKIITMLMMLAFNLEVDAARDHQIFKEELLENDYFVSFDLGLTNQEKQIIDKDLSLNSNFIKNDC